MAAWQAALVDTQTKRPFDGGNHASHPNSVSALPRESERAVQRRRSIRTTIAEWMCRVQQRSELIMLTDRVRGIWD
jgi:hypothetical protein